MIQGKIIHVELKPDASKVLTIRLYSGEIIEVLDFSEREKIQRNFMADKRERSRRGKALRELEERLTGKK